MKTLNKIILTSLVLSCATAISACSDIFSFDTEAPGRIADGDLNTIDAIPGIVAGMSYDLSQAIDGSLQEVVLGGGEIWHGGSYDFGTYPRGILLQNAEDWDGEYGTLSQARWVAEDGLRRMQGILEEEGSYERNPFVARAYLLGGFANRFMGELHCQATIDGGPAVPDTDFFTRADSMFTRAIAVGNAAGFDEVVDAAYGGRASVRAWLGQWGPAVADADMVPEGFQYDAIFSTAVGAISNDLVFETTSRKEFSVYTSYLDGGRAATEPIDVIVNGVTETRFHAPTDGRTPWRIPVDGSGQIEKGQDGETPFYQQLKYLTQDDNIALTKYTEMLMLQAEERLRAGDIPGMEGFLNEGRDFYGLEDVTTPANSAEAWELMRLERYETLWLEGRRLHDMRRWEALGGDAADPFLVGRDSCFPISDEEQRTNSNLNGGGS
jgi:hypothetical protein